MTLQALLLYFSTAEPRPLPLQPSAFRHLHPLPSFSNHLPLSLPTGLLPSMCHFNATLQALSHFINPFQARHEIYCLDNFPLCCGVRENIERQSPNITN